ncbi:putative surface protease GP63, putative,metallopeptidase [Trypanosoma grayi]|uniref:putative surface protease GP63, putative,metallopeptidase n=1 Tax=Trypanosoma grayi TaxID=71804 RepID=UPI0004F45727|nr:putative surface protease GP63, putative,metallopeptidase [Trypanosoma grayi]KEG08744.1 putative surface protease GP63, putative,metallopeptidase [Trypanosoma grayi]
MFCNAPVDALRCTSDRLALGDCGLHRYWEPLEEVYRYFDTSTLGGRKDARTDYCPVITPTADTVCAGGKRKLMPGSLLGPRSRCLNGKSIVLKETRAGSPPVGDVCAEVRCAGGAVQVKYLGSEKWHKCNEKGWIDLSGSSAFQRGQIVCPRYDEVCTEAQTTRKATKRQAPTRTGKGNVVVRR